MLAAKALPCANDIINPPMTNFSSEDFLSKFVSAVSGTIGLNVYILDLSFKMINMCTY